MSIFSFLKKKPAAALPELLFYNTLSREVERFTPLSPSIVTMYNCGPTVYDEQHIGNLRGPILANTLKRALALWGYRVRHVSNITDVGHLTGDNSGDADIGEDRMEKSAKKTGRKAQDIAEEITDKFYADLDSLGIDRSKMQFTKATDYIPEQIALVKTLWEKGYAYKISDGIYFDTSKFKNYGKLGNVDLAGERAGARVEENLEKKNPHDFALWKFSPKGERRQQEWESPWGVGFPGWHIECTAMIFKTLGKQIDIHMGGIDLAPIHHNNEIAQAEAATGKQFVQYWMHNAFITIEGKKVSKSLGNTIYLHQIIERGYSPRALRYWYLTGHYRSPMNFSWEAIEGADQALKRLTRTYIELQTEIKTGIKPQHSPTNSVAEPKRSEIEVREFVGEFHKALANDLDTPRALALVWEMLKNQSISSAKKLANLALADKVFGLGLTDERASASLKVIDQSDLPTEIQDLIEKRDVARRGKDFAAADELRKKIEEAGYDVADSKDGQKVTKK
ncbi:MAG TPA: cysteine--tRNA ligase [Candidatus Paceibacterota bacterium]|nr:cysteine--tRNA ligase [Candidatus Paceibacterota bacterium]